MNAARSGALFPAGETLSEKDYQRLAAFIHQQAGIKLPPSKKSLLEGRLRRRLRQLRLASFADYCRYLFEDGHADDEEAEILDVVTTHKTDFFRDIDHFRMLAELILPSLAQRGIGLRRPLRVWSSACSNGAETYSIAMVCQDFAAEQTGFRFGVLGTDISLSMLQAARRAIYPHAMIEAVPLPMRKRYLLRSQGHDADEVRIAPELRQLATFDAVNLMWRTYPIDDPIDIVFCRNVLIYFDKPTQRAVLTRMCEHLTPGGYLLLGHSESITGMTLPLQPVAPTVFVREGTP